MRLQGKIALVTGGSRGMGRATAVALAREGASVAANYFPGADEAFGDTEDAAAGAVKQEIEAAGGTCLLLPGDLADEQAARSLVKDTVVQLGGLDILVCNAGICPMKEFLDISIDVFDRVHAVNLRGHFLCCQEAARVMIDQARGGRIIGVSSIAARLGGEHQAHYCPTKSGLHSLMQSMAIALGPHGITCNSVGPGEIDTDMNRVIPGFEEYWDYLRKVLPLRRIGQPEDVADVVVFFAGEDSRYVTGQLLMADGGFVTLPLSPAEGGTT
jgi:L-rhamnose 1-dehydrogenase